MSYPATLPSDCTCPDLALARALDCEPHTSHAPGVSADTLYALAHFPDVCPAERRALLRLAFDAHIVGR